MEVFVFGFRHPSPDRVLGPSLQVVSILVPESIQRGGMLEEEKLMAALCSNNNLEFLR